jgi:SAM-dependent methyltransferase
MEQVREYSASIVLEQYSAEKAVGYQQSKLVPWREYCEQPLADAMLGDVASKNVLDLACGEGHYTRWLKTSKHAKQVVGVDLAPDMIKLAQSQEEQNPLGLTYICSDASELQLDSKQAIDLVFAAYLLNYAGSFEDLVQMLTMVFNLLPPAGRFVCINNNPGDLVCSHPELRKYHVTKTCEFPGEEGAVIQFSFFNDPASIKSDLTTFDPAIEPACVVDNYFLTRARHEEAFMAVGFEAVTFHDVAVSSEGQAMFTEGYWDDFLAAKPICGIVAVKPG